MKNYIRLVQIRKVKLNVNQEAYHGLSARVELDERGIVVTLQSLPNFSSNNAQGIGHLRHYVHGNRRTLGPHLIVEGHMESSVDLPSGNGFWARGSLSLLEKGDGLLSFGWRRSFYEFFFTFAHWDWLRLRLAWRGGLINDNPLFLGGLGLFCNFRFFSCCPRVRLSCCESCCERGRLCGALFQLEKQKT